MSKTITLPTGPLNDAVQRAARIAPTKGHAFDKASGILMELLPKESHELRIHATDLNVTFYQRLIATDCGDEPTLWRMNAPVLAGWLAGHPAGSSVTFTEEANANILVKCGRSRTRLRTYDAESFPKIKPFAAAGMEEVKNFPAQVERVAWAAHSDKEPLTGVHINGTTLCATDGVRFATVPCEVPVEQPVTSPLGALTGILRGHDTILLRATDARLEMKPDADTQLTAMVYQQKYPDLTSRMASLKVDKEVTIDRELLLANIDRMLVLVKSERYPELQLDFNADHIKMHMQVDGVGEVDDVLDFTGDDPSGRSILESPTNVRSVVSNGSPEMKLGMTDNPKLPLHFTDDSGFDGWLSVIWKG